MSDQPSEHTEHTEPARPSVTDSIRAKLDEYGVDRHLEELATAVEEVVRQGAAKAGELVHEHRGDIDRLLDRAAGIVDRQTDGRHADRIGQVRGTLDRGVGRIAEQRPGAAPSPDDVPPSNG